MISAPLTRTSLPGSLLVFIPNADPGNITNIATPTLQISRANQSLIFDRAYRLASRGRVSTPGELEDADLAQRDAQWGACVACAAVERARARQGHARTATCDACFARYCYTGSGHGDSRGDGSDASSRLLDSAAQGPGSARVLAAAPDDQQAASDNTGGDVSGSDVSTLERNEYIMIGLLGGIVVLLGALLVLVVRQQRAKGYAQISERVTERDGTYN